jgi:hypothetical protein
MGATRRIRLGAEPLADGDPDDVAYDMATRRGTPRHAGPVDGSGLGCDVMTAPRRHDVTFSQCTEAPASVDSNAERENIAGRWRHRWRLERGVSVVTTSLEGPLARCQRQTERRPACLDGCKCAVGRRVAPGAAERPTPVVACPSEQRDRQCVAPLGETWPARLLHERCPRGGAAPTRPSATGRAPRGSAPAAFVLFKVCRAPPATTAHAPEKQRSGSMLAIAPAWRKQRRPL